MEHFDIKREDNCIWLTDKRDGHQIHLVSSQAEEIGKKLIEIAGPKK